MSNINAKKVAKYVVLPEIIPRVRKLFDTTFGMVAFLIAQIYSSVRLLPRNHVYLQGQNIGRFGVRHVVAEAANHLDVRKENWDQITVFVLILSGIILMIGQVLLIASALIFDPVWAQAVVQTPLSNLFATPDPVSADATFSNDVVFLLMDRVFGIPNFFCTIGGTCTDVLPGGERWPFHIALHGLFEFYSLGLLVVATLIFLYFIVVVLGETVTSGTPFGERFQNIWVPIRLVIALLMLTPVHYGLNTGQWILLAVAKAGSGLATNGWHRFNNTLASSMGDAANPTGEMSTLLAIPKDPDMTTLVQSMTLIHGCAYAQWATDDTKTEDDGRMLYLSPVDETSLDNNVTVPPYTTSKGTEVNSFYVKPYFVKSGLDASNDSTPWMEVRQDTVFQDALEFYGHGNIKIRFGRRVGEQIQPVCGDVIIPIVDRSYLKFANTYDEIDDAINTYGGGPMVHRKYYDIVRALWFGSIGDGQDTVSNEALLPRHIGQRFVARRLEGEGYNACKIGCDQSADYFPSCTVESDNRRLCASEDVKLVPALVDAVNPVMQSLKTTITTAHEKRTSTGSVFQIKSEMLDRGWGGAGIWYNVISQMNGEFVSAVNAAPYLAKYPAIMEETQIKKAKVDSDATGWEIFNPSPSKGDSLADDLDDGDKGHSVANALYVLIKSLTASEKSVIKDNAKSADGNPFLMAINFIFGTDGIFDMRDRNAGLHPVAQLSMLGKGIVDSTIRNLGVSTGLSAAGGLIASLKSTPIDAASGLVNNLSTTTAYIGLTAGINLYYIVPILPFIFFFFAVGGWVKGIFEAMVGVPLWALAHLRIDGEGLAGEAASSGYLLLFESFLRPILIVFGLIAAMLIFAMEVRLLNLVWDLVVDNVGGAANGTVDFVTKDKDTKIEDVISVARSSVDQFFFTLMYAIIVYMMGTSSFKMIDQIPDQIMRWFGGGVQAFGEQDKNPAEGLQSLAVRGGMLQGQKVIGAGQKAASGLGSLIAPKPTPGGVPPQTPG